MKAELHAWLEDALEPQPAPPGATSRDIVRQAIRCESPPRIPYSFVDPIRSDFFELAELERVLDRVETGSQRSLGEVYTDAWGVRRAVVPRRVAQTNTGMAAYVKCIVVCKCVCVCFLYFVLLSHTQALRYEPPMLQHSIEQLMCSLAHVCVYGSLMPRWGHM